MTTAAEAITKVPKDKVGEIVQDYIKWDGVAEVLCKEDDDGTWTIIAH